MILCDSAQAVEGKLYILGGGWSMTGPDPAPMAVAVKIEVPWNEANRHHQFSLELRTQDGLPFSVDGPFGEQPVQIVGDFEVGRPPGLVEGMALDTTFAINVQPLPLPPGQRFEWRLLIDGKTQPDWHVAFLTRSLPPGLMAPRQ